MVGEEVGDRLLLQKAMDRAVRSMAKTMGAWHLPTATVVSGPERRIEIDRGSAEEFVARQRAHFSPRFANHKRTCHLGGELPREGESGTRDDEYLSRGSGRGGVRVSLSARTEDSTDRYDSLD